MRRYRFDRIFALLCFTLMIAANIAWAGDNTSAVEPFVTGLVIRSITIKNNDIFNLNDEREDGVFYRVGNALHLKSKKHVIEQQLLFKVGDAFVPRLLLESERLLRANHYLASASIDYQVDGEFVDVVVETADTWSTKLKLSLSNSGGESKREIGLEEENLFGAGVSANISYRQDADRSSYIFEVKDEHFLGSWYALGLMYESNSDGYKKDFSLSKPFYSLDTRDSHGIAQIDEKLNEAYYTLGEKYFEYTLKHTGYDAYYGWSSGLQQGHVVRQKVGWRYDEKVYDDPQFIPNSFVFAKNVNGIVSGLLPNNRTDSYPYYSVDYLQDRYEKVRNLDHIGIVEDRYMGLKARLELGYSSTSFGSSDDHLRLDAFVSKTINLSNTASLSAEGNVQFRWRDSSAQNLLSSVLVKYYLTQSEHFKFYSDFSALYGRNLDKQNEIFLGNETGLRGFPAHYLSGDQLQKVTLEERYYSNATPFRIFGVGAAVFLDVGRVEGGNSLVEDSNGLYSNAGFGLRIANNRSARGGVVHIDFSKPLTGKAPDQGFQINIELKSTF